MDLMDLGDMGSGCEEKDCGLASGFPEDCSNQECYVEEPVFGLIELVCVTVIYIPLMLFGLLGNILTILVVWLRPHMRSSTYLYLSSMAVSDLLILLLLPLDLYKLWRPRPWPLGDLACKVTMYLSECCTFCTILHITFLSLERYLAVCWPITAKTLVTRRRTRAVIGCLWLGAAVSAAPVLVMVGVEDVSGEELGLGQWRDDGGWGGREGEQGGLMVGGGERESGHAALLDGGLEGIKWEEQETNGWGERFKDKRDSKFGIEYENERKGEKQADDERRKEVVKMDFEGEQQNKKKEDEGGGRSVDGGRGVEIDMRECRCTHYAASSGLLSAMMILSNLYFLIPLGILGLVYSLIGRTLCLRPKSSRRDQSHRHTIKMLGVIVLAFVLCWLPFHVGRTIFSLSMGASSGEHETHTGMNSHLHVNTTSDVSVDSREAASKPFNLQDTDFSETLLQTVKISKETLPDRDEVSCDTCEKTKVKINAYIDNMDTPHTTGQHTPHIDTHTHTKTHNDYSNTTALNTQNKTNTQTEKADRTVSTASTHPTAPTDLYSDSTHNDPGFNHTYWHPDTHDYFIYYLSQYFNLVSSVLFYLSAAVNPLLYNLMSARYRQAVHSLIHTHPHTHAPNQRTFTSRHSMTTL